AVNLVDRRVGRRRLEQLLEELGQSFPFIRLVAPEVTLLEARPEGLHPAEHGVATTLGGLRLREQEEARPLARDERVEVGGGLDAAFEVEGPEDVQVDVTVQAPGEDVPTLARLEPLHGLL